jgi:hypothetical protein
MVLISVQTFRDSKAFNDGHGFCCKPQVGNYICTSSTLTCLTERGVHSADHVGRIPRYRKVDRTPAPAGQVWLLEAARNTSTYGRRVCSSSSCSGTDVLFLVVLSKFDESWIPRLEPLRCSRPDCNSVIRGSMFVSSAACAGLPDQAVVCEDCYRSFHFGDAPFIKSYKHCVLAEAITPPISRAICRCKDVPHFDGSGKPLSLFPLDKDAKHFDNGGAGSVQCSLLKLGEIVALAKYEGLKSIVSTKKPFNSPSMVPSSSASPGKNTASTGESSAPNKTSKTKWKRLETKTESSLHDSATRVAASSSTSVVTEATADEDIPLFFRRFTSRYPFGNVHMALRVGPLVIENGVAQ